MRRLRARLTYANVIATIALFIALGGGAYAVIKLPKNSVKSKQIKDGQVKNADLAADAVSGEEIAAGAIGTDDLGANAVTGENVAPGAIGADDLSATARPQPFAYSRGIATATVTVLDVDGYKITATCESVSGRPQLIANMTFPEDGFLDQTVSIGEISGGVSTAATTVVGRGPAPTTPPGLRIADAEASAGKALTAARLAIYTAPAHSAELTVFGRADDPAKACTLTGTLTETD